jgi:hypothetical protein
VIWIEAWPAWLATSSLGTSCGGREPDCAYSPRSWSRLNDRSTSSRSSVSARVRQNVMTAEMIVAIKAAVASGGIQPASLTAYAAARAVVTMTRRSCTASALPAAHCLAVSREGFAVITRGATSSSGPSGASPTLFSAGFAA